MVQSKDGTEKCPGLTATSKGKGDPGLDEDIFACLPPARGNLSLGRVCTLISAWLLPRALVMPPRGLLSLVHKKQKGHFEPSLRMPRPGQPRQEWEEFTSG